MSGEGSDSPGWTSTRAILRGGGSGSIGCGVAAFLATAGPVDLVGLFRSAAGSGVLGASLGASGMAAGAGDSGLGERQFVALLPDHGQGLGRTWPLRSLRRPGGGCPTAHWVRAAPPTPRGVISTLGDARDFGRGRGTIHIPRLQLGGRRGLLANGRGHHFFKCLLGLLFVVLGPMIVGRRRFVVAFRLGIADCVQQARSAQGTGEEIKSAHSGGGVQGEAEHDGQFGRAAGRALEPRGDEDQQRRRDCQAGKMRVAVQKQAVLVEIAVDADDDAQDPHQDHRRADDRPELLVDAGRPATGDRFQGSVLSAMIDASFVGWDKLRHRRSP